MFEKEAEEWWNNEYFPSLYDNVSEVWKEGAEFGYNKANEWHYVKDGDLPTTVGRRFLVSNRYCTMIGYWNGETFVSADEDTAEIANPIAWCELPTFNKE